MGLMATLRKAGVRALGGGVPGAIAMVLQVWAHVMRLKTDAPYFFMRCPSFLFQNTPSRYHPTFSPGARVIRGCGLSA